MFLLHALVLRFQSGTDSRHTNLVVIKWTEVEWVENVVAIEGEVCIFKVLETKSLITAREYYACDAITLALARAWTKYFSPQSSQVNASNVYFFPKVSANGVLDFSQPFDYKNHKEACVNCATWLGLPMSTECKSTLGSKAVRRGNAATVGMAVKGARMQTIS